MLNVLWCHITLVMSDDRRRALMWLNDAVAVREVANICALASFKGNLTGIGSPCASTAGSVTTWSLRFPQKENTECCYHSERFFNSSTGIERPKRIIAS